MAALEHFLVNKYGRSMKLTTNILTCEANIIRDIPQYYGLAVLKNRSDEITPLIYRLSFTACTRLPTTRDRLSLTPQQCESWFLFDPVFPKALCS